MGIMVPMARAVLKEHKRKPLTGDGLLIGRQTVPLTIEEAKHLVRSEGISLRNTNPRTDDTTVMGKGRNFINDVSFFALFCDVKFRTLDVTDYEGAEIIHDMHQPVPNELAGQFDFIWNGSCLDNMFDPAMAMRSTGRMLRPGGRVFCMEMGTPHFEAYTMFSQGWFFDYFALNRFCYCKTYSCVFTPRDIWDGPYEVYAPNNGRDVSLLFPMKTFPKKALLTVAIAEKDEASSWDESPVQRQYRPDHSAYDEAYRRFSQLEGWELEKVGAKKIYERPGFEYVGALEGIPNRRFPDLESVDWSLRIRKAARNPGWAVSRFLSKVRFG